MARRRSLLGRLLGGLLRGKPSRKLGPKRKPAARKTAAPKPPKPPKPKPYRGAATEKSRRVKARQKKIPTLYSDKYLKEVLAGKHGAEALRKVLSGARTARKNPAHLEEIARRQSSTFHGPGAGDVVELSAAERRRYGLPRWVVPLGRLNASEYVTHARSQRAGAIWRHAAGDRGRGKPRARSAPLVVADPRNGDVKTIGGVQKFTPTHGIVG
jgi:hypothetical protein